MLCRSKEGWYPCLFPEFKEKTFGILPSGILGALFFIYVLCQVEDVPTSPSLLGDFFVSGRDVDFVKCFLCICWHVGSSHGEGNGTPLQCSCLENPREGGAWWAAVYGVAQSRTRLKRLSSSSSILPDQESNLCLLHWQVDSLPLSHQVNSTFIILDIDHLHFIFSPDLFYLENCTFCWSSDFTDFSWGMWDLVPRSGIEPGSPALQVQCLSHWTTRGVPLFLFSVSFRFTLIF